MSVVTSSGVLIKQGDKYLFNKTGLQNRYDLPKGKIDLGETPLEACIRETMEESGIDLTKYLGKIKDLGLHKYIPKRKRLYLFYLELPEGTIDITECYCSTEFSSRGVDFPEVDGYAWFKKDEIKDNVAKNLYNVIKNYL